MIKVELFYQLIYLVIKVSILGYLTLSIHLIITFTQSIESNKFDIIKEIRPFAVSK